MSTASPYPLQSVAAIFLAHWNKIAIDEWTKPTDTYCFNDEVLPKNRKGVLYWAVEVLK